MPEQAALEAEGLCKRYGARVAVSEVDLLVGRGEIHGLLGANGAGKTTLLRVLLGLVGRDAGTVRLLDHARPNRGSALPSGVAGYVDVPGAYPYLTGRQNLRLLAQLDDERAAPEQARAVEEALASVALTEQADVKVRGYSAGMRQRLALAATLLRRPRLLLLDEPTSSLDPVSARRVRVLVRELAAAGTAIVLSSHDMAEVEELCTTVTVLREGRVAFSGTIEALRERSVGSVYRLETSGDDTALALGSEQDDLRVRRAPERRGLEVVTRTGDIDRYALSLGRAGVAIRHLQRHETSLEQLFLRLTTGEPTPEDVRPHPPRRATTRSGAVHSLAPAPTVSARGLRATLAVECAKVAGSGTARATVAVAALAPLAFALAMKAQTTLPDDTLFGRWAAASGFALPLVVLGFAAAWAFPVLASLVGGDVFSAEHRYGTWAALLTRSRSRGEIFIGKVFASLGFSTLSVVVLGLASLVAGAALIGRQPLIGLSGTELPAADALARIVLAWASVVPAVLGFTALALLLSVTTRSGIAGVGLPVLLGLVMELASLLDGADAARPFALTAQFLAWHGLFAEPPFQGPLRQGLVVASVYLLVGLLTAYVVFSRRDLEG